MSTFVRTAASRFLAATTFATLALVTLVSAASAQLTGPKNIPGDYATIAAAITDLNTQGVGVGGVTFNVAAGYTETITAPLSVTATGTAGNPIVFQKSGAGANPLVTAYTGGTGTPGSANQDGIWRLVGSDFVTIDGIDLTENPANVANPATMEYGYALYKASATDGCQNVTIQNCTITLNRINNATGSGPSVEGSRGINVTNATATAATTALTVTSAAGSNSNNKFYGNTIQNANYGVVLIGFADVTPFTFADTNNDVGGAALATGNIIKNFGGAPAAANPAAGIRTLAQYGLNLSFNTINSNDGAGVNHPNTFRGIFNNTATSASATINNNTITMKSAATTSILEGIENAAGATAAGNTININNNTITNCTYATATTGAFTGIINSASAATVNINGNILTGNATNATSGTTNLIQNSGVATVALNINSNNINGWTFNAATSGTLNGINASGTTVTAAVSISSNNFQNITHAVAGSSAHNYITYNNASSSAANINSNTFTNLNVNTTGSVTFIARAGSMTATGVENVNSNSIVTAFNKGGAGGTVTFFGANASSVNGSTMTNNLNSFSNITLTGATAIAGWANTEGASATVGPTKTITNNTFNNIVGGSNATVLLSVNFSGANTSVASNSITNVTAGGAITAMLLGTSNQSLTVSQNLVDPITTTGSATVTAISTGSPATTTILKNKIYDLSGAGAGAVVNGILVTAGTTVNVSNNLIGNLTAPAASGADVIRGISSTSTTAASAINLSFNTIYLNATSSGANFGSSGVFHTTSATATTAALTMKDNIIVNLSTPNGTGVTAAYRRSNATLANYNTASNNNLFYAGAPSASRLIFFDGTNSDQLLSTYKTRVTPADNAAVTENPPFLSTTGSSPDFLHIDPSVATQIESGAIPVAGIADDFDGNTRNVTTPDIGADEGNFTLADFTGPSITYTPLTNSTVTLTRSFTAVTVTDPSGVNGTLGTRPRVYYKKSGDANTFVDNTNATNGWKYVEANGSTSQFDFTIDYSLLLAGSVSVGDVIQYFVDAQDLAGTPNVSINSGIFATQPASVNLAAGNFPITGTIRSYQIVDAPLNGDYTVGLTLFNQVNGTHVAFEQKVTKVMKEVLEPAQMLPQMRGDKSSTDVFLQDQLFWKKVTREVDEVTWVPMSNGVEFKGQLYVKRTEKADLPPVVNAGVYATITAAVADLNARGVSGPVRFLLDDASYASETFPITVNVLSPDVPTASNPVAIKPNTGVTSSVSGAAPSTAIFKIFNTNFITIDGSNTLAGTTRDLTIENTSVTTPSVVWFGSSGTTPISGGALKNCNIRNGVNTSSAVVISDGTTAGNAGFFSNMEVRNNKIEKAFIGVFATGGTVPQNGSNLTYADNQLNSTTTNAIRLAGLYMQGVNGATVSGNTLANFDATSDENDVAIWLASGTINATVSQNAISNIAYTGANAFAPIALNVTPGIAGSNINVTGNTITNITTSGSTQVRGIASAAAGSGDIVIQRNNVSGVTNTNIGTFGAYGIDVNAANNFTVKNNFVSDLRFNMAGGAAFSTQFGVFGIRIGSGTGHIIDDNSVSMFGSMTGAANTSLLSAALCIVSTTSTGCDVRNNLLVNTLTGGSTSIAHVSASLPSAGTSAMNLTWNNNAYYSGTDAARQGIAQVGVTAGTGFFLAGNFNAGATTPATNLRSYTSTLSASGNNDNASQASTVAAPYTSNTDLHIPLSTLPPISNAGASIAGILDDFDGDLRSATPDIGADEFTNYTVTTAVVGNGSVGVAPLQAAYAPGSSVTLTATPNDACTEFTGWSGDASGNTNPLTVIVNSNLNITANFAPITYTISATSGPNGTVAPPGATVVACNGSQAYTITPDPCYAIDDVLVDGVSVGPVATYTFNTVTANHTISATFVQITYTINATASAGGTIAPSGNTVVGCGANQTYTITPGACATILDVLVDGVSVGPVATYTFTGVNANHTIAASFSATTYTITASSGPNGTVTPTGATVVACNGSQTYTITPDPCYAVLDVLVDGVSVGAVTTYTFNTVTADHTISATFIQTNYTISASAGPNGSIAPPGNTNVACGANQTYTITPDPCYSVLDVLVDGVSVGPVTTYTFTAVNANHTIDASFVAQTFTISASAGPNGSIAPPGNTNVACGANQTYTITPDPCYSVLDVLVDGVSVGAVTTYTFTAVNANHTIAASFVQQVYQITASAGAGGTVAPPGVTNVACGGSQAYSITPNPGFAILDVLVDAVSIGAVPAHTFTNVTANHTISATFIETVPPSVTVVSPNGGETLIIGSPFPLQWTATDNIGVTCVDLYVSRSGPSGPWETIATCVPNTSPFTWTVTGPPTTTAIFRVDAHDAAGNIGTDNSDQVFTIMDFPTATLVALFQANSVDEGVKLEWRITDTRLVPSASVERSLAETGPFEMVTAPVTEENGNAVVVDRSVVVGMKYFYRLQATTNSGQLVSMGIVSATAGVPVREFAIERAVPNPTSSSARIGFAIPRRAPVRLSVFDALGREVAVLASGPFEPGRYSVTWSGEGSAGRLAAGMYFVRFQTPDRTLTGRIVLEH